MASSELLPELAPFALPAGQLMLDDAKRLQRLLDMATRQGVDAAKVVLPQATVLQLFGRLEAALRAEPTLVEIQPPEGASVTVVGDTHGQFHDVCRMLELAGYPAEGSSLFIFNGDFVDRGAWGLETLVLLAALKLAAPAAVTLLRGNHETATCTLMYGFKQELVAKYGKSSWRPVYAACKRAFAQLPLAALIANATLVLHGGLFRAPPPRSAGKRAGSKRKRAAPQRVGAGGDEVPLGSLDDLRRASKGGMDPNGLGASRLATDVLWSDPVMEPGLRLNDARGVGMVFGPDVTERFLRANGLSLVLRSHEGPDAREGRDDMGSMLDGWTLDHQCESGSLMTVFSAPDYPQFIPEAAQRYQNRAAVAVLTGPRWAQADMRVYEAVAPRPEAAPFYDLLVYDSDEDYVPAASGASGMTDVERDGEEAGGEPSVAFAGGGSTGGAEAALADDAATATEAPEVPVAASEVEAAEPMDAAAADVEGGAAGLGISGEQQRGQQTQGQQDQEMAAALPAADEKKEQAAAAAAAGPATPMDPAPDSTTTSGDKENAAQRAGSGRRGAAAAKAEPPAGEQQAEAVTGGDVDASSPIPRAKRAAVRVAVA